MTRDDAEALVKSLGAFVAYGRTWSARKVVKDGEIVYLVGENRGVSVRVPIDRVILGYFLVEA